MNCVTVSPPLFACISLIFLFLNVICNILHSTTLQIFLMLSQIFAAAISAIDRHPPDEQEAVLEYHLAPFETFVRELWWEVARNPTSDDLSASNLTGHELIQARQQMEKSDGEAQAVLRELLVGMVSDSYALLSELFHLGERGLTERLSAEYVARYASYTR